MREFRIFVSSPGDVAVERRRVDDVVSRLNGEFLGQARFVTVRWETGFYRAHETYQTQIPRASECDIVVGILKWRLGTPLPSDFDETLPGGEFYPSGTAYEILTAMEKRRAGAELPDVFVFRCTASAPQLVLGDPDEDLVRREWDALCRFIARWFETPTGQFLAAFNPYASQDDFEAQLELLLRAWCTEKVSGGQSLLWPPARGSPFRGLKGSTPGTRSSSAVATTRHGPSTRCAAQRAAARGSYSSWEPAAPVNRRSPAPAWCRG